jgi:hypothetical protein
MTVGQLSTGNAFYRATPPGWSESAMEPVAGIPVRAAQDLLAQLSIQRMPNRSTKLA